MAKERFAENKTISAFYSSAKERHLEDKSISGFYSNSISEIEEEEEITVCEEEDKWSHFDRLRSQDLQEASEASCSEAYRICREMDDLYWSQCQEGTSGDGQEPSSQEASSSDSEEPYGFGRRDQSEIRKTVFVQHNGLQEAATEEETLQRGDHKLGWLWKLSLCASVSFAAWVFTNGARVQCRSVFPTIREREPPMKIVRRRSKPSESSRFRIEQI